MRLTPLDIQQQTFKVAFRGYDREQVAGFLERIRRQYEEIVRENVEITTRMNQVLDALGDSRARVEALEDRLGEEVEDALCIPEIELADGFDAGDLAMWGAEEGAADDATSASDVAAIDLSSGAVEAREGDAASLPHEVPVWTPELAEAMSPKALPNAADEPLSSDDDPGVALEFRPGEDAALLDAKALSALSEVAESLKLLDGDPDELWTLEGLSDDALLDAEREAAEVIERAKAEAETIRADAQVRAKAIVEEARLRADRILGEAQDELDMIDREIMGLANQRDRLYRSLRHIVEDQARLLETFDELEAHFYEDYDGDEVDEGDTGDAPPKASRPRATPHDTEEAEVGRWPEVLDWEIDEDAPEREIGPTALERKVMSGVTPIAPPEAEALDAGQ